MGNAGFTVLKEDFESSMGGSTSVSLVAGENPVGLFNINVSSTDLSNNLVHDIEDPNVVAFAGNYREGSVDLKFHNFVSGSINGFGGHWKETDEEVGGGRDIRVLVNGEEINISDELKGLPSNKRGFVGIMTMLKFDNIEFVSRGQNSRNTRFRLRHIQLGGIDVTAHPTVSHFPTSTFSASPSLNPSVSLSPTTSPPTTSTPSSMPMTIEEVWSIVVTELFQAVSIGIASVIEAITSYFSS